MSHTLKRAFSSFHKGRLAVDKLKDKILIDGAIDTVNVGFVD
jgi:hypothetical protein